MSSIVGICNLALSYLGGNSITSLNDNTPESIQCNVNYEPCRDSVLEEVNWSFAIRRFILSAKLQEPPVFGYANAYLLPVDIIRVISVNERDDTDWALENREILTDAEKIEVVAIRIVEDTNLFSPMFVQTLAAYLATEMALSLTGSPQYQQTMAQAYMIKKRWAQGNDGRQGKADIRRMKGFRR